MKKLIYGSGSDLKKLTANKQRQINFIDGIPWGLVSVDVLGVPSETNLGDTANKIVALVSDVSLPSWPDRFCGSVKHGLRHGSNFVTDIAVGYTISS